MRNLHGHEDHEVTQSRAGLAAQRETAPSPEQGQDVSPLPTSGIEHLDLSAAGNNPAMVGRMPSGIEGVPDWPVLISDGEKAHTPYKKDGKTVYYATGRHHIMERHGHQLKASGFDDADSYISHILKNANEVRLDERNGSYFIIVRGEKNTSSAKHDATVTELKKEDGYYLVKTASPFKSGYLNKKTLLQEGRRTTPSDRNGQDHPLNPAGHMPDDQKPSATVGAEEVSSGTLATEEDRNQEGKLLWEKDLSTNSNPTGQGSDSFNPHGQTVSGTPRSGRDDERHSSSSDSGNTAPKSQAITEAQSYSDQIDRQLAALGDQISPEELAEIRREMSKAELDEMFGRLEKEAGRYMKQGLSPREALEKAGARMADEERLAAIIEANARKKNLIVRAALRRRIVPGDEAASLEGILAGKQTGDNGAALSVDASSHARTAQLLGPLMHDLEKAGVFRALLKRDEQFDADVAREMWRLDDPKSGDATGNKLAAEAARILSEYQDTVRLMQNRQGAWIGKADHYVTRQSHDMWKIRGDGSERSYQNGRDWLSGFKGTSNKAKKVSQNRVLHFRDADGWLAYNRKFGQGHVVDSIFKGLISGARNAAVMGDLGTNPENMFRSMIEESVQAARERADAKMVDRLRRLERSALLDIVTGRARQPADLVRFASGQIPFGNLPGINAALKYGVIYRLQDMINPGYTARYEKLVQHSQGQGFLVSPTWSPYGR